MALAVAMCAGEYGHAPGRMNTNLCRLAETGVRAGLAAEHRDRTMRPLTTFELGDKEDLRARADRLEIGGLMDGTVDCDGSFLFEVVA